MGQQQDAQQEPMSQADMLKAHNDSEKNQIAREKVGVDAYRADTDRMTAQANVIRADDKAAFAGSAGTSPFQEVPPPTP